VGLMLIGCSTILITPDADDHKMVGAMQLQPLAMDDPSSGVFLPQKIDRFLQPLLFRR